MRTIQFDNETFWQVTDTSAIRPHNADRVKVLKFAEDGSVTCKSHTVKPSFKSTVDLVFAQRGIV
ncbi:hypothetical protein [Paenibacillus sp. HJGM_3]|uniref:hypothetical protein n=1 Tax=Paenibacillus sp. HJGM_3 TaxID=3379816 RepID=UPI00385B5B0C